MKKKACLYILIIILSPILGFFNGVFAVYDYHNYQNLKIEIRSKKSTFYTNDNINVYFYIKNVGNRSVPLGISKIHYHNYKLHLYSLRKEKIPYKNLDQFNYYKNSKKAKREYKHIVLENNQFYGQEFNLQEIFDISKPGIYILYGYFYPISDHSISNIDSEFKDKIQIKSPKIQIEILEPPYKNYEKKGLKSDTESYQEEDQDYSQFKNQKIKHLKSPSDIAEFILKAYLKNDWNSYFKYIDIQLFMENYLKYNSNFYKKNLNSPSIDYPKKHQNFLSFKEILKKHFQRLNTKIDSFQVEKSVINNKKMEAQVFVNIKYREKNITYSTQSVFFFYNLSKDWYLYSIEFEKIIN